MIDALLHYVDKSGEDVVVLPKSVSDNIYVDAAVNDKLPQSAETVADIIENLGSLAFENSVDDLVSVATDEEVAESLAEIFGK